MDTATCEFCQCTGSDDNSVAPVDFGAAEPTLLCDLCCEFLRAELEILAVLR
jgi:hypothetical protein